MSNQSNTFLQTDVQTHRNVFSALGTSGECPVGCKYCFVNAQGYTPNPELKIEEVEEQIQGAKVVMLACDTELFLNPTAAMASIAALVGRGVDITFATKLLIAPKYLALLQEIQQQLMSQGNLLSVMVSLPILYDAKAIEPRALSPERRIEFLHTLSEANLFPFVGIRPLLPDHVVSLQQIDDIVSRTAGIGNGYIIGPYWFSENSDYWDLLSRAELAGKITQKAPEWLPSGHMFKYEDPDREAVVRRIIESHGSILHDRSSEVMPYIRNKLLL